MTIQKATNLLSLLVVAWAVLALSCTGRAVGNGGGTDGNTHWLGYCTSDGDCETGLSCLCQTCTKACDATAACSDLGAQAECLDVLASCGASAPERTCSASCNTKDDCPGSDLDCEDGRCVAVGLPNNVSCDAMDAREALMIPCTSLAAYVWDGEGCVAILACACMGDDCDSTYDDRESCYDAHSACDVQCPKIADECPEGCGEIRGAPYYPDRECNDAQIVLGCNELDEHDDDANCLQSPDGIIVDAVSGTYVQQLMDYGGYTSCTDEMIDTARNASGCGECGAMDARATGDECAIVAGYTWDGEGCVAIQCSCIGDDCGSLFEDPESCLAAFSSCSVECPKIAGACPDGCEAVTGSPYYPDRECRLGAELVLGCFPSQLGGPGSTGDGNCLQSPEGTIVYDVSGTYVQQLIDYGDYARCSEEAEGTWQNASICVGDPSLEGRSFQKIIAGGVPEEVAMVEIGLQFQDGLLTFSADCNGGIGAYSLCDGNLCVDSFSSTRLGCDSTVDNWLIAFFTARPMLILDGGNLTFASDTASLGFVEVEPVPAN